MRELRLERNDRQSDFAARLGVSIPNLTPRHFDMGIYRPRNPQASGYFRCVQDHFEQLEMKLPGAAPLERLFAIDPNLLFV